MPGRFPLVVVAALAGAVLVVAAARMSSAPTPGRTIVWSTPAVSAAASPDSAAIPKAPPPPPPPGGTLPGLIGPLSGLFDRLRTSTQHAASGQYSILQQLAGTLQGWVQHLLTAVPAHR